MCGICEFGVWIVLNLTRTPMSTLRAEVGKIETRVDLAWKFERVQLPGPSLSLSAPLQSCL